MTQRKYIVVSGFIFAVVALIHFLRILNLWDLKLGDWVAPMALSGLGLLVPGFLALVAYKLTRK